MICVLHTAQDTPRLIFQDNLSFQEALHGLPANILSVA